MSFGTTDGMKNSKCDGSSQPAGIKTKDRKLWIPTLGGVVIVDPAKVKQSEIPPPVIIEQMHFDKKEVTVNQAIQIGPGKGDLEFQYTAICFTAPAKLKFKYMLVGFDNEWIDVGTRRTAYYTGQLHLQSYCLQSRWHMEYYRRSTSNNYCSTFLPDIMVPHSGRRCAHGVGVRRVPSAHCCHQTTTTRTYPDSRGTNKNFAARNCST
jgi:hypothetical protein